MKYEVGIAVSFGRKLKSFCMLTQEAAEVLYDILDQDEAVVRDTAKTLMKVMSDIYKTGQRPKTIRVDRKIKGTSLLTQESVEIPWQAGMMLGMAVSLGNAAGLENLKSDLRAIIAGTAENRSIRKPFFASEGFKVD